MSNLHNRIEEKVSKNGFLQAMHGAADFHKPTYELALKVLIPKVITEVLEEVQQIILEDHKNKNFYEEGEKITNAGLYKERFLKTLQALSPHKE